MTNVKDQSSSEVQSLKNERVFDLEERTARFGEQVIEFVKVLPKDDVNRILIDQLVRAATSVGGNYVEADGADSKKDFRYKISLCRKELKESKHWLRMIATANTTRTSECTTLSQEAHELTLIFSAILRGKK